MKKSCAKPASKKMPVKVKPKPMPKSSKSTKKDLVD